MKSSAARGLETLPVQLRAATVDDRDALAALKLATYRQTFIEGFGIPYPPADLEVFEAEAYGPATIERELADPSRATWVAVEDGRLLGYAQAGPCKLPHPDVREADGELYQLYVERDAQGLGLGGRLLAVAMAHLEREHPGPLWLGVWSGNLRAQAIYGRLGFRKVGEYRFQVGSWFDDEFIFRRG